MRTGCFDVPCGTSVAPVSAVLVRRLHVDLMRLLYAGRRG